MPKLIVNILSVVPTSELFWKLMNVECLQNIITIIREHKKKNCCIIKTNVTNQKHFGQIVLLFF